MKFVNVMSYTWNNGDQVHQLDPMTMVPETRDSENTVRLWTILEGMTEERATEISLNWKLSQIRKERDKLIAATDWWVLPDRTSTAEQLAYRQALRDVTEGFTDVHASEFIFPEKP